MEISMSGYSHVRADARTVKDLRDLLRFLDDNRVTDSADLDWGEGYVYVIVADSVKAEFIECGDHIPPDLHFDVILNTHSHHEPDPPETFEEALERDYKKPAKYDWPSIDRYGVEGRPE